jgi:cytochrome c556
MNTRIRAVLAAGIVAFSGVAALAHSGATGVVKERMEGMKAMGDRGHAGSAMTELFPEGSNAVPSEAKEDIWKEWETFAAMAHQLEVMAEALGRAAANATGAGPDASSGTMMGGAGMMGETGTMMGDSGGMMGGLGMMGASAPMMDVDHLAEMPAEAVFTMMSRTCSACHTRFRAEED